MYAACERSLTWPSTPESPAEERWREVMKRCETAKQIRTAKPAPTITRKVTRTPLRAGGWLAGWPATVGWVG